jgi:alkanesulfonate monooxygenase SsuD/methylene tetrahydromethanopterin reductase-like flavin-dependent oxidoreductase (luciferase family)
MKFGAFLWQRRGEDLAANARLAEELGFESVWMGEHLGFPIQFKSTYPYDESGMPPVRNDAAIHDPLIVFAYLAGVTSTIKFGTGVYILPSPGRRMVRNFQTSRRGARTGEAGA